MARMKQLAKWSGLTLAGLLLLLGLAVGLGYGYLQSDSGRDWAAREIERLTSTPGEVEGQQVWVFAISPGSVRSASMSPFPSTNATAMIPTSST